MPHHDPSKCHFIIKLLPLKRSQVHGSCLRMQTHFVLQLSAQPSYPMCRDATRLQVVVLCSLEGVEKRQTLIYTVSWLRRGLLQRCKDSHRAIMLMRIVVATIRSCAVRRVMLCRGHSLTKLSLATVPFSTALPHRCMIRHVPCGHHMRGPPVTLRTRPQVSQCACVS